MNQLVDTAQRTPHEIANLIGAKVRLGREILHVHTLTEQNEKGRYFFRRSHAEHPSSISLVTFFACRFTFRPVDRLPLKANLRAAEIADYLDISLAKIYEMLSNGTIPSIHVGRSLRVPRDEFEAWYASARSNG